MATQAENKAAAEDLLKEAWEVGAKIRALNEQRKQVMMDGTYDELTRKMDEQGKKAMGIYAQAQVYATLATIPDPIPSIPKGPSPAFSPADVATPNPGAWYLTPEDWITRQAKAVFPDDRVEVRRLPDQEKELYEVIVTTSDTVKRYSFVPDPDASDPYKFPPLPPRWKIL